MPAEPNRVETIFHAALNVAPADRSAFLAAECGADRELRARVDRLLAAHAELTAMPGTATHTPDRATASFDGGDWSPAPGSADTEDHLPRPDPKTVIAGKYKLLEEIGEGGMGTVWMADQTEPVKRRVAVKLIKAGMDSKAVLARFEAERQALALMDHPNIAKVLDAGATADGRPFFVMELVKGVPITRFCDDKRLTPRERLELFVPVCQAIQHAHQKGIIHRDIKPSNVLIALYDDRPVPKVIDFGVAKAAGQPLTDRTLATGFGAVVGTPEYMSPEQASFNNLDIDTRSDVYALGVLLYELLAGGPPFSRKELEKIGLLEIFRVIREQEPPRPSTRLSTADALPTLSANRGTDPKRLTALVRGELDWIVMKALEKDRNRRYESANGFAADVQRHLAGEAVQAAPPSPGYRLKKFVRRHKRRVAATAAFFTVLVASVAVTSWLAVQAKLAGALAEVKRVEAEANAEKAQVNADAYWKASEANVSGRVETEIKSLSLQVDLDLIECRADRRVGLLRLAKPMRNSIDTVAAVTPGSGVEMATTVRIDQRPEYHALREFVAAAVLTAGQSYAPLLPPITHDGHEIKSHRISPDGKTILTLGADGTARLWDAQSARPIAVLQRGFEQVIESNFSPDGNTIYTYDKEFTVRFWNNPSGQFRAQTQRPDLDTVPSIYYTKRRIIGNHRMLTIVDHSINRIEEWKILVELWDTFNGKRIARWESLSDVNFDLHGNGQWITANSKTSSSVVVFSGIDGRQVAMLTHPETTTSRNPIVSIAVSPDGKSLATFSAEIYVLNGGPHDSTGLLRIWDTSSWGIQNGPIAVSLPKLTFGTVNFFSSDIVYVAEQNGIDVGESAYYIIRCGASNAIWIRSNYTDYEFNPPRESARKSTTVYRQLSTN